MRQFDFYEFTGVIAPGVILLLTAGLIWPDYMCNIQKLDITLGGFGLALLITYVTGHLLQGIGNVFEWCWWKVQGGWPSDWPRTGKGDLLSKEQVHKLEKQVQIYLGYTDFKFGAQLKAASWYPVFRQIYASVRAAGRDDRAHTFNGNYGMFRGIVAATLVSIVTIFIVQGLVAWPFVVTLLVVALLAAMRMHRFGKHYARETLIQFISLCKKGDDEI